MTLRSSGIGSRTSHGQLPALSAEDLKQALLARLIFIPDEEILRAEEQWVAERAAREATAGPAPDDPREDPIAVDRACAPPDGEDAWLALLPEPLLAEYCVATTDAAGPEVFKAGFWDRTLGEGAGFACGGVGDRIPPGPALAGFADRAWQAGLGRLSDDELIGVLRAARRLSSWAAALELSAVSDLMRRRLAEEAAGQVGVAEHASDEVAAALTLTGRAAGMMTDRALMMRRLPAAMRALALGDIDLPRAMVIADETMGLSDLLAGIVDAVIAGEAPSLTTGQLRAAARRAVIAADPAAVRARKERAEREARVERWDEPAGTAALAGRDLPPAEVLAADCHISDIARQLRAAGVEGSMDNLRARVYLALLAGQDPASLLPDAQAQPAGAGVTGAGVTGAGLAGAGLAGAGPAGAGPAGAGAAAHGAAGRMGAAPASASPAPAGGAFPARPRLAAPALRGTVNLTLPLATWLGLSQSPGEVAGYGPLDAADSNTLASRIGLDPRSRWCVTVTDARGHPLAHGCAPSGPGRSPGGQVPGLIAAWLERIPITGVASGTCSHVRETPAYRPPPSLQHIVRIRHQTCSFPGCRRPAARCDLDHTLAYQQGGRSCECNLAPLCRRHHRAKQAHGWRLEQPEPGVLVWTTPAGRAYTSRPTAYPG